MSNPRRTGTTPWRAAGLLLASLACARGAGAQQPAVAASKTAVVVGIVADTGKQPIVEAEVLATRHKISTITDARGFFILPGLGAGPEAFLVRKIGYRAESFDATLVPGDTIRIGIILGIAPFQLPDLTVEAEGRIYAGKMAGFADRLLHSGAPRSSFFTQEDIDKIRPRKAIDLLSRAGLPFRISGGKETIGCPRGASGLTGSKLMVYIDGARMGGGFDLSWLDPSDIQAVEVYKSAAQRPAEFSTGNADCTVVIWTR